MTTETYGLQRTFQHLLRNIHIQGGRTGSDGDVGVAVMTFSSLIGHVSLHFKMIIAGSPTILLIQILIQIQEDRNFKGSLHIGNGFSFGDYFSIIITAPPPKGTTALHRVFHLGTLNGNASKTLGRSADIHGIASLVGNFHLIEFHLKGRTLIFFHAETLIATVVGSQ